MSGKLTREEKLKIRIANMIKFFQNTYEHFGYSFKEYYWVMRPKKDNYFSQVGVTTIEGVNASMGLRKPPELPAESGTLTNEEKKTSTDFAIYISENDVTLFIERGQKVFSSIIRKKIKGVKNERAKVREEASKRKLPVGNGDDI